VTYEAELTFSKATHLGQNTIQGFTEFAGVSKTTRFLMGAPDAGPGTAEITTVVFDPESRTVTLTVEGTLSSTTAMAIVEGSTDLQAWTSVTSIPKTALVAGGGRFEVTDFGPAAAPTPYKFYRLMFP
jgi:hypothetical protein